MTFWSLCEDEGEGGGGGGGVAESDVERPHRLRAREGCFLMTDTADVESAVEPTNNNKVLFLLSMNLKKLFLTY